jgi:hypothetical protein
MYHVQRIRFCDPEDNIIEFIKEFYPRHKRLRVGDRGKLGTSQHVIFMAYKTGIGPTVVTKVCGEEQVIRLDSDAQLQVGVIDRDVNYGVFERNQSRLERLIWRRKIL